VCGNGVVEAHEDCDTFSPNGASVCRPKGTDGECHLDCRPRSDGTRPSCPANWGCDFQGICRAPTGQFEASAEYRVGGAWSLASGDFDGDGRADVVSREPVDAIGRAKLRFHYFDDKGALADTRLFPKLVSSPAIADLSSEGRSDIVFSDFRVGVLLGQADRSLVPETFPSYHLPSASVRLVAVYDSLVESDTPVMVFATLNGVAGFHVPDHNGALQLKGELPGPIDTLMGDPINGNLFEDPATSPCLELVFAVRGADRFSVADTCQRSATTQEVQWRDPAEQLMVLLDPPAPIDAPPFIADMNVDGHLDVVLGAGGRPYVSYGDGRALSVAIPYRLELANPDEVKPDIPMPLAAGDFTGDGRVDFVFRDRLLVSIPAPGSPLPRYVPVQPNAAAPWTDAKIADLNGNGKVDVVAASSARLDIDFFNGTGTQFLTRFSIPTERPVQHLAVGDFDGDLIDDLAFVETAVSASERDAVMIAFGAYAGPPLPPTAVARVKRTEGLSVSEQDHIATLMVSSAETVGGKTGGVFTLLDGSGDRLPYAPLNLVSFTSDGLVASSAALALTIGGFTADRQGDVMALATRDAIAWELWLLPEIETSDHEPARFRWDLDPRLVPARLAEISVVVNIGSASADVDGDGRDEALWAMPADSERHCGLAIVGIEADGSAIVPRGTLVLDEPCLGPQLLPVDADGDGAVDIALLTGAQGELGRKLMLLWNDGKGQFSSASVSVLSGIDESPQGVAVLAGTSERPLGFAYVTDVAAMLVNASATPRRFDPPRELASVARGSGIVAADVNGDGVTDLVLAASGNLVVLQAQLKGR